MSPTELAHARRFGVRRAGTSGRARVERRERERAARAEVMADEDPGLDSARGPQGGNWLDTFLQD
ncbi:MAG: hypothetical protein IPK37_07635 [Austwickia sp.]|nr:MAG: hypothetical protein IPK37_07635 [Austwickia sp.]